MENAFGRNITGLQDDTHFDPEKLSDLNVIAIFDSYTALNLDFLAYIKLNFNYPVNIFHIM